jgi:hypothetical protein
MTTSIAGNWLIAAGGFTGLIGMWLVLAWGVRSARNVSRPQPSRPVGRTTQQDGGIASAPTLPPPGPAAATIAPQRGAREKSAP